MLKDGSPPVCVGASTAGGEQQYQCEHLCFIARSRNCLVREGFACVKNCRRVRDGLNGPFRISVSRVSLIG
jgi:hypothetical protein